LTKVESIHLFYKSTTQHMDKDRETSREWLEAGAVAHGNNFVFHIFSWRCRMA